MTIDRRVYYINDEIKNLLIFLMNFSLDYVKGVYKINNLSLINYRNNNYKNILIETKCDKCKKKFHKDSFNSFTRLYCYIDNSIEENREWDLRNKFKIICGNCQKNNSTAYRIKIFMIFPIIDLITLEELCKYRFLTKYIFNIDLDYKFKKEVFKDELLDVGKSIEKIIHDKKPNEQIEKIVLKTYEKLLFSDNLKGIKLEYNFEEKSSIFTFDSNDSDLKDGYKFQNMTYFYEVHKKVFKNTSQDYIIFTVKPFLGFDQRLKCRKCETLFYRKNLILYCSKCGFINRMLFTNKIDINKMVFFKDCVKAIKNRLYYLIYYDMNIYSHCIARSVDKR